ncbi:hypothetical protein GCM10023259_081660 [Thermocatellispora tengchongensis]
MSYNRSMPRAYAPPKGTPQPKRSSHTPRIPRSAQGPPPPAQRSSRAPRIRRFAQAGQRPLGGTAPQTPSHEGQAPRGSPLAPTHPLIAHLTPNQGAQNARGM